MNKTYRHVFNHARATSGFATGQGDHAQFSARLGWQRAGGDLTAATRMSFASGSTGFSVESTPLERDTAFAQAGLVISPTESSRISVQATARSGDDTHDFAAQLGWSVDF